MIETNFGEFEIIKDDENVFNVSDFNKRYVEILGKYEFIIGDYFQGILRLKGFTRETSKRIPDYINEYCSLDSNYYILRNPNFNLDLKIDEE
ncbi:DUF1027 domain-containing protein [bacterium]|nr:DUF1027 domain-containing protein [bacterium]